MQYPIDTRALEQLLEYTRGDKAEYRRLIETFLVDGDDIVTDMRSAASSGDALLLRRSAQAMKASAQDFGASRLTTISAALESRCRSGMPVDADEQVGEIDAAYEAVREALREYLRG